jgi:hypothetical protein
MRRAACALVLVSITSAPARAEEPAFELGAKASYASAPIRGGTTPFGAGFGGRLGFSVSGLYLGISVINYLGGSDLDISNHAILFGGELGYGFRAPLGGGTTLTIRPQVGLGNAAISHTDPSTAKVDVITSASGRSSSSSDTTTIDNLYVEPALVMMVSAKGHFAALTGGLLVIPRIAYGGEAETWMSYGLTGQVGFVF